MAKKKAAAGKKTAVKRKRVRTVKSAARRTKATASKKKKASRKVVRKQAAVKKKVVRKAKAKKKKKATKAKSLGRPRVTLDAKLDMLFQKDYQAREVFDYLRVSTVRELEEHSPDEIIKRLAGPLYQTVQRIRKTMALCNRCLSGDQKFALEFKEQLK